MKYLQTLLVLLLSSPIIYINAQPSITGQSVFQIGESVKVHLGEGFFTPGPSGENATWDFSTLNYDQEWDWVAYDPSETMFSDSFPSATLAFKFPQGDTADIWEYYLFRNDSLSWLGAASVLSQDSTIFYQVLNLDPDVRAVFPFTYGSSFSDHFRGKNKVTYDGSSLIQRRFGTSSDVVDAYGTLTTPYGTFNNTVRIKTIETVRDTLDFFIPVVTQQDIVRYTWYSEDERYILLHLDSIVTSTFGFPAAATYAHMYRAGEIMTSIDQEQLAETISMNVYPNPASEQIHVQFTLDKSASYQISLSNIIGQKLIELPVNRTALGTQNIPLDISEIGAGYYLLTIQTEAGIAAKKIRIY